MILTGKRKCWGKQKSVPVPLCLPKISHGLASDRNRTTAVRLALISIKPVTHQLACGGAFGWGTAPQAEGLTPDGVTGIFHWPHSGTGLDSASNRNEYQEYFLWSKSGRRLRLTSRLSWNLRASTSWNPRGLSRPVQGLLYLYIPIKSLPHTESGTFQLETQTGGKIAVLQKSQGKKCSVFPAKPGGAWRIITTGFQKVKLRPPSICLKGLKK